MRLECGDEEAGVARRAQARRLQLDLEDVSLLRREREPVTVAGMLKAAGHLAGDRDGGRRPGFVVGLRFQDLWSRGLCQDQRLASEPRGSNLERVLQEAAGLEVGREVPGLERRWSFHVHDQRLERLHAPLLLQWSASRQVPAREHHARLPLQRESRRIGEEKPRRARN